MANERRVRLGVWAGYELPDLGLTAAGPVESRFEAAYWDTPDLRLSRRGVTVREEDGAWTLRGPDGRVAALDASAWSPGAGRVAADGRAAPGDDAAAGRAAPGDDAAAGRAAPGDDAAAGRAAPGDDAAAGRAAPGDDPRPSAAELALPAAVLGWTRGEPLCEVARLVTARASLALSNRRGEVARLARDDVTLLRGERVAARFHELELTALDGAPVRLLERIEARLREAGAQSLDPVPKVIRGLAPAALEPPPSPPGAGPEATAADALRARLAGALERWTAHQAPLQLDGSPDSVRGIRGGIRALRRDLRVLTAAADAREALGRGGDPRAALGRVADPLTVVRRLDRLIERAQDLPGLRAALTAERAAALEHARATCSGPRYAELLREAAALVENPPLPGKLAGRPAADVLPGLVRKPLKRLTRAPADDPERRRKLADHLAAAATAAAPYADAKAALAELDELRAVLREHRQATIAVETLAVLAARSPEHAWEAGLLAGTERTRAAEARKAVPYAFARATRRKLWAWVP